MTKPTAQCVRCGRLVPVDRAHLNAAGEALCLCPHCTYIVQHQQQCAPCIPEWNPVAEAKHAELMRNLRERDRTAPRAPSVARPHPDGSGRIISRGRVSGGPAPKPFTPNYPGDIRADLRHI